MWPCFHSQSVKLWGEWVPHSFIFPTSKNKNKSNIMTSQLNTRAMHSSWILWGGQTCWATRIDTGKIKLETSAEVVSLGSSSNAELGPRSGRKSTFRGSWTSDCEEWPEDRAGLGWQKKPSTPLSRKIYCSKVTLESLSETLNSQGARLRASTQRLGNSLLPSYS